MAIFIPYTYLFFSMKIFLSCVNCDFRDPGAPFAGFRDRIRPYLSRGGLNVTLEEEFHQSANQETLEKLDDFIRKDDVVIQLLATNRGAIPDEQEVIALKEKHRKEKRTIFSRGIETFSKQPAEFRKLLENTNDVTYTEWESYLAIHNGKGLLLYLHEENKGEFAEHIKRLGSARPKKFTSPFSGEFDLACKIFADICRLKPEMIPDKLKPKVMKANQTLMLWILGPCLAISLFLAYFGIKQMYEQWPYVGGRAVGYLIFSVVSIAIGYLIFYLRKRRASAKILEKEIPELLKKAKQED
ncbi:MAG: hypothetical protein P1U86_05635 [Verrucomicrobiales bacterium]|nr:hypothetical protein [Verrucomicrobiales bacterium]